MNHWKYSSTSTVSALTLHPSRSTFPEIFCEDLAACWSRVPCVVWPGFEPTTMQSSQRIPDRPTVQALVSSLRPVNLTSSHSTPPVFTCIVTDYGASSTANGQPENKVSGSMVQGQRRLFGEVVTESECPRLTGSMSCSDYSVWCFWDWVHGRGFWLFCGACLRLIDYVRNWSSRFKQSLYRLGGLLGLNGVSSKSMRWVIIGFLSSALVVYALGIHT